MVESMHARNLQVSPPVAHGEIDDKHSWRDCSVGARSQMAR
jgi:hypothetical protein